MMPLILFIWYFLVHDSIHHTFTCHHSPKFLSHLLIAAAGQLSGVPAEPRIELGPALQQADTLPSELRCILLFVIELTINVPVVFMARYVMVLRGATSLPGALEGVGPENQDFKALKWHERSKWHLSPKKSSNDVAPLKTIKYKRHKNNWYIGSFMYPSAVV
jgi:hypothetical protein